MRDSSFTATDDCGIVRKYIPEVSIYVVNGEERNVKLTYPEDTFLLDKLFQLKSATLNDAINLKHLNGKVMVVYGGNSGIGKDMLDIASKYGAKAYAFSRSTTGTDIADFAVVAKSLASIYEKEGKIDFVVNSAAILNKEPLMHLDKKTIKRIIDINYYGMLNVTRSAYEYVKESKGRFYILLLAHIHVVELIIPYILLQRQQ